MNSPSAGREARYFNAFSVLLLTACLTRLWLLPLTSSLWVDELVTVFVLRFPRDASFAAAPQVTDSVYYWLPRMSWALLGNSEWALRLPSVLSMGAALFFVARIARRIVHPRAAWFSVFLCLTLSRFDYFAADARPYAVGIAVASAGVLFLIRWFDEAKFADAAVFVVCAALLWRIHLLFWPFYFVYLLYAAARISQRNRLSMPRKPSPLQIGIVAAAIGISLIPVAAIAVSRLHGAAAHVFSAPPTLRNFAYMVHLNVLAICAGGAWILSRIARPRAVAATPPAGSRVLVFSWWLACPVCLFVYSRITGNGVFLARYLAPMLPGVALAAAAAAARFIGDAIWRPAAVVAGLTSLALMGGWSQARPPHDPDDWRRAAAVERAFSDERTPVLCASPFVEARFPVWTPDYRLPGFLYANLAYYPIRGRAALFPFSPSDEARRYADRLVDTELAPAGRFILYGSRLGSGYLLEYLEHRPELANWRVQTWRFGDILLATFEAEKMARR